MENNLMQELAAELNPREVNLKELNLQAESNDANENDAEGSVKKQPYVYRNAFEVTNVVIPAINSIFTLVPFSFSLKNFSIINVLSFVLSKPVHKLE